jgi:glycosyltransferase involved in cell wall biosynthesis
VVATDRSGAEDLITQGVEGTIVPARDAGALAAAMLWHYRNPQATAQMGKAARARVEQQFTLAHYEERMIGIYRRVAETGVK